MASYSTPGVYIEEISTFPATVNRVATGIPVFIGYTEENDSGDLQDVPTKISSMLDYETSFGGEPTTNGRTISVSLDQNNSYAVDSVEVSLGYYTYHAVRHFFSNGGGSAYILSVGTYSGGGVDKAELIAALADLEKADEPTLVLVPDAFTLSTINLGEVQNAVLAHCQKMQDRFGIFDVKNDSALTLNIVGTDATNYRSALGNQYLKYGAAYYPELVSTLASNGDLEIDSFSMKDLAEVAVDLTTLGTGAGDTALQEYNEGVVDLATLETAPIVTTYQSDFDAVADAPAAAIPGSPDAGEITAFEAELLGKVQAIDAVIDRLYGLGDGPVLTNAALIESASGIIEATASLNTHAQTLLDYDLGFGTVGNAPGVLTAVSYNGSDYGGAPDYALVAPVGLPGDFGVTINVDEAVTNIRPFLDTLFSDVLALLSDLITAAEEASSADELFSTSQVLASIKLAIQSEGLTLPPSGAIAGIYASTDRTRGVWKAPANVSLNAVSDVARKMLTSESDDLNIPGDGSGKAINAIRFFRGKGNLVYGARTLAGNSNEWRYVPVRRLFIMVEESILKATEAVVFEPNDANTWQKVKGMIESFLFGLWRDGALAGATPEDAFFVKVGLNDTMTAEDILNGYLIVEIGMAAVRPAEFIILKFSHKLQES